ncbi:MAG: PorP/SprF family type IX secretion system membrane protein, partial [Bacteroidota bacterium]
MRILIIVFVLSLSNSNLVAQQSTFEPSNLLNGLIYNPAFSSYGVYQELGLTYRLQWLQIDESINNLSLQGRLSRDELNIGVGAYLFKDSDSVISTTGAGGTFSYNLVDAIGSGDKLRLGLGVKMLSAGLDTPNLIARDQAAFESNFQQNRTTNFDIDFGILYTSNDIINESHLTIGLSIQNLASLLNSAAKENSSFDFGGNSYLLLGYKYIEYDFYIEPKIWVSYSHKAPIRTLIGIESGLRNFIEAGLFFSNENTLYAKLGYTKQKIFSKYSSINVSILPNYNLGELRDFKGFSFD